MLKYDMIKRGEGMGVGLSGGKDSIATLFILNKLAKKLNLELCAIAIDEGIAGYRDKTLKAASSFCSGYNIPLHVVSFKETLGYTLDEMAGDNDLKACTYCGVFRRKLLNEKARELNLDKVATGHNLDDEVQVILMNYIRGDVERLVRLGRSINHEGFVRRVKPLVEMPEKEVALYAILKNFDVAFEECPYVVGSFRIGIRDFINDLEKNNAGIKYSILRGYQEILPFVMKYRSKDIKECKICGGPTSQELCKTCKLLKMVKNAKGKHT
jgi:uncharacterized protein (TIGR00269 family)